MSIICVVSLWTKCQFLWLEWITWRIVVVVAAAAVVVSVFPSFIQLPILKEKLLHRPYMRTTVRTTRVQNNHFYCSFKDGQVKSVDSSTYVQRKCLYPAFSQ